MVRVWRYVLAVDNGLAPCIDNGQLTLCCCKPVIRKGANKGEWVVAFMPKRFGCKIAWAGCVDESMTLGEYSQCHAGRTDAIYRLVGMDGDREILRHSGTPFHRAQRDQKRDKRGRNALIFNPFCYFGANPVDPPPEIAKLAYYRQGQSTVGSTDVLCQSLRAWLDGFSHPVNGLPRDPQPKSCR